MQGVSEADFFSTVAQSLADACLPRLTTAIKLHINRDSDCYTYRHLSRDIRTLVDRFNAETGTGENLESTKRGEAEGEGAQTKKIKLILLMDEIDTLNTYNLRTNLNLRGLFMVPFKENMTLIMTGLHLPRV